MFQQSLLVGVYQEEGAITSVLGVCFHTERFKTIMGGCELFMVCPLCEKRKKDSSLDTPAASLFNSHANKLGGNTHHE